MRVFASDVIKKVMGTFKIPEEEPIYNSMITRALEKAQTRIEELNFDARKHVLAYDDVLNVQRMSVYSRRRALLTGGEDALESEIVRLASYESAPPAGEMVPAEDFKASVARKKIELGALYYSLVRRFFLQTIDFLWVEHLEAMEYLRSSVNLRAYGQRDPLVEYKKEGLQLFQTMEASYAAHVRQILPHLGMPVAGNRERGDVERAARRITAARFASAKKTFGRNDRVKITNGIETKEMKFKRAEPLIAAGKWKVVE